MHLYHLFRQQWIPRHPEEVFLFFQDPENLTRITPKKMKFKNLSVSPQVLGEGSRIVHSIRVLGIPLRWVSLITQFNPPNSFIDEQLEGPYAYWRHVHSFREERGGTRMEDRVSYALPLGSLGRLAHFGFVARELKMIFDYRQERIKEIFGG